MLSKTKPQVPIPSLIILVTVISFSAGSFGAFFALSLYSPSKSIIKEEVVKRETINEYTPQTSHEERVINVVRKVSDGVVSIIATKDVPIFEQYYRSPFDDPLFNELFPEFRAPERRQRGTEKQQISAGTGFVASSDGLIITNKHVVADKDAEYTVITNKGEKISATVLARDPIQDLAIVKIETSTLPALELGDSENLEPGQSVIAIGNALGEFQNTVSVGVISGLRRTIVASSSFGESERLEEVIQTDSAINPGNSGGPLINLSGEVIGINVAVASGAENIGFAIPVNRAKKALNDIKEIGRISYPFLGVRYLIVTDEIKEKNNLSVNYGALVVRGQDQTELAVVPGSAADKAGIVENDIILEIDGKKITQDNSLAKVIQDYKVGDTVRIKLLHKGEEKEVSATLTER